MQERLINTGKCIWCGRTKDEAPFETIAHVLPRSMGGSETCVDVCDAYNHYFGTAAKGKPNIDWVTKEIFTAFRVFGSNLHENSYKELKSKFFHYKHSTRTIHFNHVFNSRVVTDQFKKGLYEIFLQKYHNVTGNGNHPMFDMVRKYAIHQTSKL